MPRHRTAHTSERLRMTSSGSCHAPATLLSRPGSHNLVTKINHLVQLLTNADDLPRSAHGWVFLRALRRYDGPAVPGNQDPQTNQIVHSHPFSLTSHNSAIDFTEKVLGGMAACDRRKRLTLGEAIDHNNKASIVVALTSQLPKRILISIHQPVPRAHLNTVDPIPLAALPPFGVYYCDWVYTLPGLLTPANVPAHLIPALASPNTDIINRKITWTLRFPLPAPAEGDPQNHRFADLALHASGHRSAAALRNALQLATTTTAPPDHEPSNARFIRLPDPTNGHNNAIQSPAAPPLLSFDGSAGELLVSHHASSRTPLPAHTARKHCSCFSAANSAFPYAPGSSPDTKRTNRRFCWTMLRSL